jgi:N-acetylmuramoyl-L-alanine amidase
MKKLIELFKIFFTHFTSQSTTIQPSETQIPSTQSEQSKEIKWEPSPNFSSRNGNQIKAIILHHTGKGGLKAAVSWFKTTESKVSAHYVIDVTGEIYQMVKDEDKAWHAGDSELYGIKTVNSISIGIELVNTGLEQKYNIEDKYIVGHKDICIPPGRKNDPHDFDWVRFFKLVND